MNIALVQSHIIWEERDLNLERFAQIISCHPGIDFFLLPEMSFTGFSMNTAKTADYEQKTSAEIKKLAVLNRVSIGFGWVRKSDEKCENVYTIMDSHGRIISEYVKIHPFSYADEDKYYSGGNEVSVYKLDGIPLSTFICYDLRFPEIFRLVCKDVHAVIIPANWPGKRAEHWKTLLKARAIENQVYIFAVNCVGEMYGQYYSGDSCIINPNGDVIKSLSDKEGVITYDFEDDVEKYRKNFPVLTDIKTGLNYERLEE